MRCNCGCNPKYLLDQHLIAEYRELLMIPGQLAQHNFTIKRAIPSIMNMGTGYMTFWKDKLLYLQKRHKEVVNEMQRRNFVTNYVFDINIKTPKNLINDWSPDFRDTTILRKRIIERFNQKTDWYRYKGKKIGNTKKYCDILMDSDLYYV